MPRTTTAMMGLALGMGLASADDTGSLRAGSYEVQVRLELPHLENIAATEKKEVCLPGMGMAGGVAFPVLSDNNPLRNCPAKNVLRSGSRLSFAIVCEGVNSARADAIYTLSEHGFRGRIAMTMGGKNMTMTEVQIGRRLGECTDASPLR